MQQERSKMISYGLKIKKLEKKIKQGMELVYRFEWLLEKYYPEVLEKAKREAQEEEDDEISEEEN